jgi:DNA polymerase III delta prime subunit
MAYDITIHGATPIHERMGLEDYKKGHKKLPYKVYQFNSKQLKYFMEGWLGADGCIDKNGHRRLSSSNKRLVEEAKIVLDAHGKIIHKKDSKTTGVKAGVYDSYPMLFLQREPTIRISEDLRKKLIKNYRSCIYLRKIIGHGKRYHLSRKMLEGVDDPDLQYLKKNCTLEKFKSIKIDESNKMDVYDLEMENDSHSFVVNGFSAHNCTTEPEAFKPTIHSRCITLNFEKIDWCQLYNDLLLKISKLENIDIEEDALKFAAKRAKGSARNALQNFQTLISFVGKDKITLEMAQKVLGSVDDIVYYNFIQNIVAEKPNPAEAIKLIDNLITKGKNSDEIINGLEYYLRNLIIVTLCKDNVQKLNFTQEELKRLEVQSNLVKVGVVSKMIAFLIDLRRGILVNMDLQTLLTKFVVDSIIEVIKGRAKK